MNTGADKFYNPTCKATVECNNNQSYNLAYTDTTLTACKCAPNSYPSMTDPTTGAILACKQCPTGSRLSNDGTTCVCDETSKGFSKTQMACVSCPSMYVIDSTKTMCNINTAPSHLASAADGNKLVCDNNNVSTNGGRIIYDQGGNYGGPLGNNGRSFTCCPTFNGCDNPYMSNGTCSYPSKLFWNNGLKNCTSYNRRGFAPNKYTSTFAIAAMPANYTGKW
jgi:hypothetical protein